jgi:carbon storage regulator
MCKSEKNETEKGPSPTITEGTEMLVLSRKPGERIVVPDCELSVTIVAIEGGRVRLGIAAPKQVNIYRDEVWRAIRQTRDQTRETCGAEPDFPTQGE